jgi:Tol biopolymer transport system component
VAALSARLHRVGILCFALLVLSASSAHGTAPGKNGRIAFERLRNVGPPSWGELFVMNADGSGARKITHPPNGTEDSGPDWSPDGSRIAFGRAAATGAASIWTVAPDGSGLRRLSPYCPPGGVIPQCPADDGWAAWSPDGKHVAFQRLSGALRPKGSTVNTATGIYKDELVVTDPSGGHVRTLLWQGPWKGDPQAPAWSPDGKQLVFLQKSDNGGTCECRRLEIINANGSGVRRLTPPSVKPGGRPDWSPDGSTILFRTHPTEDPSGVGSNLYTIRTDGTGLHQLTHFPSYDRVLDGSYSPDGKSIVFATSAGAIGGVKTDLFVMASNGTGIHPITRTTNFEAGGADWGTSAG